MASLITHPIIPIAMALVLGRKIIPAPILIVGVFLAVLPDVDVIAFRFGIPYSSEYGHRGFTHSIAFALSLSGIAFLGLRQLGTKRFTVFVFLFLSILSHGLLDAFTDQGHGVAFYWPFSDSRIFFSLHSVETSPLSLRRFVSARGWEILRSEAQCIWLPSALFVLCGLLLKNTTKAYAFIDR